MVMKMKHINLSIAFFSLLLFSLVSCKDFLNEKPRGVWYNEIYNSDVDESLLILSKLYTAYDHFAAFDFCFPVVSMQSISTGDAVAAGPSDGGTDFVQVWSMTFTAENAQIRSYYTALFDNITSANQALQMINEYREKHTDIPMEREKDLLEYEAEAYFIRSLAYYQLTQAFGAVPYANRVYEKDEASPEQISAKDIRAHYCQDLLKAITYLPTRVQRIETGNQGRATRNAALAILAKTALYEKEYSKAIGYVEQIISSGDNDLQTPFAEIWHEDHEFCSESVWEVACECRPTENIDKRSQYFQVQGFRGTPNLGWGHNGASETLKAAFEKGDPRYATTVIEAGDILDGEKSQGVSGFSHTFNGKCYCPLNERKLYGRDDWCYGYWSNIRTIRYSDIILVGAEAYCELGQGDDETSKKNREQARQLIEMVRNRARNGNVSVLPKVTTDNPIELREAIHHERRIELALEQERYFDLVRWGEASTKIKGFITGKHELFPIPQSEIDNSKGTLHQNPGY